MSHAQTTIALRCERAATNRPQWRAWAIFCAIALLASPEPARAQQPTEYQVEVGFLYNFVRFVEWPPNSITNNTRFCIIGEDPFGTNIDALAGKAIGNRIIEVKDIVSPSEARTCQILFIAASEASNLKPILDATHESAILTIGNTLGFARRGVIINFYLDDQKVRFEINVAAAKREKLAISSQLLKLARIVSDQGEAND